MAGVAYHFGVDPRACLVAAGLCSFAGMLPDIDSDTSKSFQECIYLTAGIGCILTAARLRYFGVDPDFAMLGGAFVLLLVRFGLAPLIKKITVHRGMIHSIPMAILCGQIVFFIVSGPVSERLVKAAALTIGFLSHLVLDEVYSIDSTGAALRFKKSFGTALKWTNPKKKGAVTLIYTLVACFGLAALCNPEVLEQLHGNVVVANQSDPPDSIQPQSLSDTAKVVSQEIKEEAAKFLMQTETASPVGPPHSVAAAKPAVLELQMFVQAPAPELSPIMQIGNDWNRDRPAQPAPIVLPR